MCYFDFMINKSNIDLVSFVFLHFDVSCVFICFILSKVFKFEILYFILLVNLIRLMFMMKKKCIVHIQTDLQFYIYNNIYYNIYLWIWYGQIERQRLHHVVYIFRSEFLVWTHNLCMCEPLKWSYYYLYYIDKISDTVSVFDV